MVHFEKLDPELEALDLQNQELGKKGAQRLARVLLDHQCLRELNLACANIGDAGCAFMAGALQRNSSLESLNLRNNRIGQDGVESIAQGLTLSWKEKGATMQLTELNLGHNLFGDSGLQTISQVVALGFLKLLDLSNLKMVTADGWKTFCSSLTGCRLNTLKLRQNDQLAEAALTLALALKTDVGALEELDLSLCSVRVDAAVELLQLPLRFLQLLGSQIDLDLEQALANSSLEMLDLCNCRLGTAAATALADVLLPKVAGPRRALRVLHLDRNLLCFDGAVALSKGLRGVPAPGCRLQVLTLRENRLGDGGVGAIAEALEDNMALKELDLSSNEVGDLGGQSMGLLLKKEPRLSSLSLKSNQISDAGAEALAQGLEKNGWLEELDLSRNHIKMLGVSKLCAALEANGTLHSLVLEGNQVKSDVLDSVEELAADVLSRRERQPKTKVRIEEDHSPIASDDEAEVSSSHGSSASEEAREEEPPVANRANQDTMTLVNQFVQRFATPGRPLDGAWEGDEGERARPSSAIAKPPRPLEAKVLPRSASEVRRMTSGDTEIGVASAGSSSSEVPFQRKEPGHLMETKSVKPKGVTKVTRKIRGCDIQRLWSEQATRSKIREEIEAGRPSGLQQMEWQLSRFMAELEAKQANVESVILDLAKELVRTAQEVENINFQGASVEERLERLELKMCQSGMPPGLEERKPDALLYLDLASAPTFASSKRREVATWSGFAAPGELISQAQEKLSRPQTLPAVFPQASVDHRKLLETAASKAIADAFGEASLQLRALSSELMSSMQRLAALDLEAKKKDLSTELQLALESLEGAASKRSANGPPGDPGAALSQKAAILMSSNHLAAVPGEALPAESEAPESPKARVAKRRPSQRILGALACLGVVRPADDS